MDVLTRFGSGGESGRVYTFTPDNQISLSNNFANMVTRTERIPGASGGFGSYRDEPLSSEIGSVSYSFWMYYNSASEGKSAREALMAIADWGLQRLWVRPMGGLGERWCWAVVNNITSNWNAQDVNHRRVRVTITFHVPDPFWYSYPFEAIYLDDGHVMDTGALMSGWASTQYVLDEPQTLTVTVGGNVATLPKLFIEAAGRQDIFLGDAGLALGDAGLVLGGISSGSVENFEIALVDRDTLTRTHWLAWRGLVANDDRLVIDTASENVVYENSSRGNVSGWPELARGRAVMLMLRPGVNRLDVGGVYDGTVLMRIEYVEAWR